MNETVADEAGAPAPRRKGRVMVLVPLVAFMAVAVLLAVGLTKDPRKVPSPLIGKPVPEFDLPAVKGRELAFASKDLRGDVTLVNVFASWCVACRQEHPLLVEMKRAGLIPVHGLNYKDEPADAAAWLDALGDPYTRTGVDLDGRVGIEWGVYGVPESFVIDREGRIRYKHIGPITPKDLQDTILPLVQRLREAG